VVRSEGAGWKEQEGGAGEDFCDEGGHGGRPNEARGVVRGCTRRWGVGCGSGGAGEIVCIAGGGKRVAYSTVRMWWTHCGARERGWVVLLVWEGCG
jgi:hypothetical protein